MFQAASKPGSSPRVWGQGRVVAKSSVNVRIIPTRVGTRKIQECAQRLQGDHPHACGDKKLFQSVSPLCLGSSPRVWGQVLSTINKLVELRIIPTRVGTSLFFYILSYNSRDHPHACGDKSLSLTFFLYSNGSSPRVWGQVTDEPNPDSGERIIPTRVGTSLLG